MANLRLKLTTESFDRKADKSRRKVRGIGDEAGKTQSALDRMAKRGASGLSAIGVAAGAASVFLIGRFFKGVIDETQTLEKNMATIQSLIDATGGAAGRTADQLLEQARALGLASLASVDGIQEAQKTLLTFRHVSGDVFDGAMQSALNMSEVLGTDVKSSIMQIGKALEDPARGLSMLSRSGTTFTNAQIEMIKALTKAGKLQEAQKVILAELNAQYGGAAKAATLGYAGAIDTLAQRWQRFKIELGQNANVLQAVTNIVNGLANILDFLSKHMTGIGKAMEFATEHAELIGAAMVAAGAAMAAAFAPITGSILAIAGAITFVAVVANRFWPKIADGAHIITLRMREIGNRIKAIWTDALVYMQDKWARFLKTVSEVAFKIPGWGDEAMALGLSAAFAGQKVEGLKAKADEFREYAANFNSQAETLGNTISKPIKTDGLADGVKRVTEEGKKAATVVDDLNSGLAGLPTTIDTVQGSVNTLADIIPQKLGDSLMSLVDETKSVSDAFRDMATEVIREMYRVLVVERIVSGLKNALSGFTGNIGLGLGAPAAPENIAPSVAPIARAQKPPTSMEAGGQKAMTVNQTIHVSTGVQQTVRAEVMGMMPQMAEMTVAAVNEARSRGRY